ncbi:1945_t:CDS:2, partial [Racocetra persica]
MSRITGDMDSSFDQNESTGANITGGDLNSTTYQENFGANAIKDSSAKVTDNLDLHQEILNYKDMKDMKDIEDISEEWLRLFAVSDEMLVSFKHSNGPYNF